MDLEDLSEEIRKRYNDLELEDAEIPIRIPITATPKQVFSYVGLLFTDKDFHEPSLCRTISKVWQPKFGINIKCIGPKFHFLVSFYHQKDYECVWYGSPWSFNNKLFALTPLKPQEDPRSVEVKTTPMWIQVFGVPTGYVSMQVCEAIGKFGGTFLEADENNFKISRPVYLRVRVLIDVSKPLKRRMRLCINEGIHVTVQFQYERLPSMCLICGMFQHTEATCPLTYNSTESPRRMYDPTIKATIRKNMITEEDRYLRDENGCSLIPTGYVEKPISLTDTQKEVVRYEKFHEVRLQHMENNNEVLISDPKRKRNKEVVPMDTRSALDNITNIYDSASSTTRARQMQ